MTDNDFLLYILEDGRWRSHTEILSLSQEFRGYGLTVHSRAADLRKRGHVVETRLERDQRGRTLSFYRLVGRLDEASGAGLDASSSAPSNPLPQDEPSLLRTPTLEPHGRDGGVLTLFGDAA